MLKILLLIQVKNKNSTIETNLWRYQATQFNSYFLQIMTFFSKSQYENKPLIQSLTVWILVDYDGFVIFQNLNSSDCGSSESLFISKSNVYPSETFYYLIDSYT